MGNDKNLTHYQSLKLLFYLPRDKDSDFYAFPAVLLRIITYSFSIQTEKLLLGV